METGVTIYMNQEWEMNQEWGSDEIQEWESDEIHILEGINRDETYEDPDTGKHFVRIYEGELPAKIKINGNSSGAFVVVAEPLMQPD